MLLSPQHFTSHPPVDGIRAVVVEKLSTGRLQEGYRGGEVRGGPIQTLSMAPTHPKAGPTPHTWQWGN